MANSKDEVCAAPATQSAQSLRLIETAKHARDRVSEKSRFSEKKPELLRAISELRTIRASAGQPR